MITYLSLNFSYGSEVNQASGKINVLSLCLIIPLMSKPWGETAVRSF